MIKFLDYCIDQSKTKQKKLKILNIQEKYICFKDSFKVAFRNEGKFINKNW